MKFRVHAFLVSRTATCANCLTVATTASAAARKSIFGPNPAFSAFAYKRPSRKAPLGLGQCSLSILRA